MKYDPPTRGRQEAKSSHKRYPILAARVVNESCAAQLARMVSVHFHVLVYHCRSAEGGYWHVHAQGSGIPPVTTILKTWYTANETRGPWYCQWSITILLVDVGSRTCGFSCENAERPVCARIGKGETQIIKMRMEYKQ